MEIDFVSFDLAKKLKEKGFKQKCLAYYDVEDNVGLLCNTQYSDEALPCQYTDLLQCHNTGEAETQPDDSENCVDAPILSQVLKWLRKEKKLYIGFSPQWQYTVYDMRCNPWIGCSDMQNYDDYMKAVIAGIEYVLDNLI